MASLIIRRKGKYIVVEVSFKEALKRRLERYLMKSSSSLKNQRVVLISTVSWFYGVEVLNFKGLSTSLWVDNVQVC